MPPFWFSFMVRLVFQSFRVLIFFLSHTFVEPFLDLLEIVQAALDRSPLLQV